jgi:hypothetical protein
MNGGKRARPWQDDLSRVGLTLEEILPRPPYRGAVEASIIVLAAEVADFRCNACWSLTAVRSTRQLCPTSSRACAISATTYRLNMSPPVVPHLRNEPMTVRLFTLSCCSRTQLLVCGLGAGAPCRQRVAQSLWITSSRRRVIRWKSPSIQGATSRERERQGGRADSQRISVRHDLLCWMAPNTNYATGNCDCAPHYGSP